MKSIGILALVAAILAGGCQSLTAGPEDGKIPMIIVEMSALAGPGEVVEIEAAADGTLLEVEAGIPVSQVPQHILDAAGRRLPGAAVIGAEVEWVGGRRAYEVKMASEGLDHEFVYLENGFLVETEEEIRVADAPAGLVDTALRMVPGSALKSVEKVTRDGVPAYHVKVTKGPDTFKTVLSPDGKVLRHVREVKAELEIPIRAR